MNHTYFTFSLPEHTKNSYAIFLDAMLSHTIIFKFIKLKAYRRNLTKITLLILLLDVSAFSEYYHQNQSVWGPTEVAYRYFMFIMVL